MNINGRDFYCIVYQGDIAIDGMHMNGQPIFSQSSYLKFPTESAAYSYLHANIMGAIKAGADLDPMYLSMYTIDFVRMQNNPVVSNLSETITSWYCIDSTMVSEEDKMAILRYAVINGFNYAKVHIEFLDEVLTSPKYSDIVSKVVPRHMIENKEQFMTVGIKYCPKDELGAIIMTSSDDLLQYIGIDRFNISG